ncbi:MAG: AGE family epimerase/isomerase [Holosporales bacterium]|jgi:N-acylglucosamine 2-epimerase|nr:AGE family epimerase/isomerase [Holosporales bacterium]
MDRIAVEQLIRQYKSDLFDAVLPFWVKYGFDRENGGINTCLDRKGNVFSAEKSVWMQGRGGWLFSHVCNVFGMDSQFREMAESAIEFTKKYCIDPGDGRMYFLVSANGTPIRKRRYVFSEYFYIMANAEYYGLSREKKYLDEARKYYNLVYEIWKNPAKDPFKITPKFLLSAPTMRGLGNDLVLLLVTRTLRVNDPDNQAEYKDIERCLIDSILHYQYNDDLGTLLESVGPNGEYISNLSSGRIVNPGHCLECAWYLLREAEELQDTSLVEAVENIYDGAFRYGWDEKFGGLLYFIDVGAYPPQAYEHDMKLWWVHAEAIIAAIKLYRVTGKEKYWNDFVKLNEYVNKHFRDDEFGEWYGYLRRDGNYTEPVCKGNLFKGPFHVPRMYCEVLSELRKL